MKKVGHYLRDIDGFPHELLAPLLDEFSIVTAEELVAMAGRSVTMMCEPLHTSEVTLQKAVALARGVIPQALRYELEVPIKTKFSKGAILDRPNSLS